MTTDKINAPDYEALARDMMQQWQNSWKTVLQESPAAPNATPKPADETKAAETDAAADPVQAMQGSWQNMMQPMMAATQQFWQQVLTPAATEKDPQDAVHAASPAAKPAEPTQPTVQPVSTSAPTAPTAAAPVASADTHAELARRVDLISQRLLRCEVELDKLKKANNI